ncbi:MAG: type II toxin-antitoxin system RelE/ParE family toxin [Gammaproteobacteria bacterium]|jgi:phage-related protein
MGEWRVVYYSAKVKSKIWTWPKRLAARYKRIIDTIKVKGPNIGMPITKPIGDGLFEIRVQGKNEVGRVFFCYIIKREVFILHGFVKKTQEIPLRELRLAQTRMKEVKNAVRSSTT